MQSALFSGGSRPPYKREGGLRYRGARSPKKPFRHFVRASFSSKNKRVTGLPPLDPPMLFKTGTSGTGTMCPSERDVLLIESQIKGVKKGMDEF